MLQTQSSGCERARLLWELLECVGEHDGIKKEVHVDYTDVSQPENSTNLVNQINEFTK